MSINDNDDNDDDDDESHSGGPFQMSVHMRQSSRALRLYMNETKTQERHK